MSLAGSSSDHLLTQSVTGGRPAESNKSTSLRLLIRRHGTPQANPLPDEGNEKDSDYDDDDTDKDNDIPPSDEGNEKDLRVQKNKKERDPPYDPGPPGCIECGQNFQLSKLGFTICEPCDKFWGLLNGLKKRNYRYRPPGYVPGTKSQPSPAMRYQDASHQRSQQSQPRMPRATVPIPQRQQLPPLVSNYEKQHRCVPPPPLPPFAASTTFCAAPAAGGAAAWPA